MRTPFGRCLLAACLLAPGLAGTLPAAEGGAAPPDRKALDRRVYDTLREVINQGAELYNGGNPTACCYLYQGALLTLPPLLEHRPDLQKTVRMGLAEAQREPAIGRRAFALRGVIDQVYNAAAAGPQETHEAARLPVKKEGGEGTVQTPPKKPEAKTLWERLGGDDGVNRIADDFVELALKDKRVNFTRDGKFPLDEAGVKQLKRRLVELASTISGGNLAYPGKSMKEAHKGMHITDAEFNAALDDMRQALQKNHVGLLDMGLILAGVESTRKNIVEAGDKPAAATLWERLGGKDGMEKIAGDFVNRAVNDDRVNFSREGKFKMTPERQEHLKQMLVGLASSVSGGNVPYPGKSMKEAHKDMGITDAEFDACLEDLQKALETNGVKEADVTLIMTAAKSTRKNIVEVQK
jgi:truncated hemoglobin YjbI